jgi:hypothetical protein
MAAPKQFGSAARPAGKRHLAVIEAKGALIWIKARGEETARIVLY